MRIAVTMPYSIREITGVGTVAETIALRAAREGIKTSLVVPSGSAGIMLSLAPTTVLSEVRVGRVRGLRNLALASGTLVHLLKSRPSLIHAHTPHLQALASIVAARILGIPSIVTFHGVLPRPPRGLMKAVLPWIERMTLRLAHVVTAVCDATRNELDRADVIVIHNGVEIPCVELAPQTSATFAPKRGVCLVYAGRFARSKGIDILLESHRRITQDEHIQVGLLLIGGGEASELEYVRRAVRDLRTDRTVRVVPAANRYQPLLASGDIFVFPSLSEGLPLTLLDAMATGLAPIATPVGGIPEVITHAVDGLLVPVGDVSALTDACLHLVKDEVTRKELGRRARERVLQGFTAERMSRQYVELYQRLLGGLHSGQRAAAPGLLPGPNLGGWRHKGDRAALERAAPDRPMRGE